MEKTKRDQNNMLDQDDADKKIIDLQRTLVTETLAKNRDNSFASAKGNRRDVVVKFVIYRKNTIDGHIVKGDYQDEKFENLSGDPLDPHRYHLVEYVDGEIDVRDMPMPKEKFGKWLFGSFLSVNSYLVKMGITELYTPKGL
jgi:hypothetical protein